MRLLNISAEIDGALVPVGTISGYDTSDFSFQYLPEYCRSYASALSISLPIQEASFSAAKTFNFFDGLLPEGFTRRSVAQ